MYLDQIPENDIGLQVSAEYGIPIFHSIPNALCLGGEELAVDGVLSIGEHGDYAYNEKGQHLYPRRYFFEQICGVIATSARPVPVFNDKQRRKIRDTVEPKAARMLSWCGQRGLDIRHLAILYCLAAPVESIVLPGQASLAELESSYEAATAEGTDAVWREFGQEFDVNVSTVLGE